MTVRDGPRGVHSTVGTKCGGDGKALQDPEEGSAFQCGLQHSMNCHLPDTDLEGSVPEPGATN